MKIRLAKRPNSAGTLVEVVVAISILAVVGAGVLGSFKYGFFAMSMVRENQRATQIMLAKVETLRLYRWDQVVYSNNFIPATFTDVYDPQAPTGFQGTTFNGYVAISNCPAPISTKSYATNMRQCTVTLNWTTGNIPRSRSVTTYIARDGVQNYVY
jgi:type II secretory pathway pseudopilin PulG